MGVLALFLLNTAQAQQMLVDLSTGVANGNIPVGSADDNWKVLIPGTGSYVNTYVNNGWVPAASNHNYSYMDPWVQCISPAMDPTTGMMLNVTASGQHIYRLQFNFNKTCNNITSARLMLGGANGSPYGICTGDEVTGLKLNGYTVTNPTYPTTNYLNIDFMSTNGATPQASTVPTQAINISPGFFVNGTNSFYIVVDPSKTPSYYTAALMVDAYLEINYTYTGPASNMFDLTGSSSLICPGTSGSLSLGFAPGYSGTYSYVVSPGGASGTVPAYPTKSTIAISPTATTNYGITVTNASGCPLTLNQSVTVPAVPTITADAFVCSGSGGHITINNAPGASVKISVQNGGKGSIYTGTPTGTITLPAITSTTTYIVTITDVNGCVTTINCTMTIALCTARQSGDNSSETIDKAAEQIIVAPNPSQGVFVLSTGGAKGQATIQDATGKVLLQLSLNSETKEYSIDLTGYAKGLYILSLNTDREHVSKKLIIE